MLPASAFLRPIRWLESASPTRDESEDRDDQRDYEQEPEEIADSNASGDRKDEQDQDDDPEKRHVTPFTCRVRTAAAQEDNGKCRLPVSLRWRLERLNAPPVGKGNKSMALEDARTDATDGCVVTRETKFAAASLFRC